MEVKLHYLTFIKLKSSQSQPQKCRGYSLISSSQSNSHFIRNGWPEHVFGPLRTSHAKQHKISVEAVFSMIYVCHYLNVDKILQSGSCTKTTEDDLE